MVSWIFIEAPKGLRANNSGKTKEQTNHGSDGVKLMIGESKDANVLWSRPSLQDRQIKFPSLLCTMVLREHKEEKAWDGYLAPSLPSPPFDMQISNSRSPNCLLRR